MALRPLTPPALPPGPDPAPTGCVSLVPRGCGQKRPWSITEWPVGGSGAPQPFQQPRPGTAAAGGASGIATAPARTGGLSRQDLPVGAAQGTPTGDPQGWGRSCWGGHPARWCLVPAVGRDRSVPASCVLPPARPCRIRAGRTGCEELARAGRAVLPGCRGQGQSRAGLCPRCGAGCARTVGPVLLHGRGSAGAGSGGEAGCACHCLVQQRFLPAAPRDGQRISWWVRAARCLLHGGAAAPWPGPARQSCPGQRLRCPRALRGTQAPVPAPAPCGNGVPGACVPLACPAGTGSCGVLGSARRRGESLGPRDGRHGEQGCRAGVQRALLSHRAWRLASLGPSATQAAWPR